jgi:hypothetical protein
LVVSEKPFTSQESESKGGEGEKVNNFLLALSPVA